MTICTIFGLDDEDLPENAYPLEHAFIARQKL
jgi:hypothetical protein